MLVLQAAVVGPIAACKGWSGKGWARGAPVVVVAGRRGRAQDAGGKVAGVASAAVFEPMKELEKDLFRLPQESHASLARLNFTDSCESSINELINVLYSVSYLYHSLFAYFDRDNVALLGFSHYFKEESDQRRKRAEELMMYQNKRGGRVGLKPVLSAPAVEFEEVVKSMELANSLEKLLTEKFYDLQRAAEKAGDKHLNHLVKSTYLAEQIEIVKRVSEYVAQLRRIGEDGHGIYYFDRVLGGHEA
ncbi:ferritin heavy chain [Marchantia polymorpha subsp. ruderalis]|uniref:Ferritin n=2 Tax=Marchantia polymorpha TaxID=3197 RepID=A0AAF6AXU3_MARPO|nr:hypothetical protein MARPO_0006s0054 [Marchantia polymorpha]BBN04577.1 hypothetical protein Mp_3g05830 [Marchantia polymorpha subsp. ruderalis]|eukprot:PTQ48014.1 hypothetical protein MARPO_0006s0054 [Marchantia polymorpha]